MRSPLSILITVLVLGLMILASNMSLSQGSSHGESPLWYWFKVGAYAKYLISLEGPPYTIKVRGEEYSVDPSKRYVLWNITGFDGEWFTVNQSLIFEEAIRVRDKAKIPVLVAITREFKVNVKTLTALTKLSDKRVYDPNVYLILGDYIWAFDWIFLLNPQSPVKIVGSIVPGGGVSFIVIKDSQAFKDIMRFISQVNETVFMLSNGSRRYDIEALTKPEGVRIVGSSGDQVFFRVCPVKASPEYVEAMRAEIDNIGVYLLTLSDPPALSDYILGSIRLGRERLMHSGPPSDGSVRDHLINYVRVNKLLYGLAELNFTDPKLKAANVTALITVKGHLYCINPLTSSDVPEVYYDVVSGILVYAKVRADEALDLLWFRDPDVDVSLGEVIPFRGVYAEIKLIETNIDLSRPVIGKTRVTTPTTTPTTPITITQTTQTPIITPGTTVTTQITPTATPPSYVETTMYPSEKPSSPVMTTTPIGETPSPELPITRPTFRGVEVRSSDYTPYILIATGLAILITIITFILYRRR